ncbi:MAG: NACHT domain-containing protein [Candidatus Omnitrophica bacterium]|nr:NACHT domain-containing protein [Candidatus Omnitrophota bacterium]
MINVTDISLVKKYRYLLQFSEDDFRDKVVRPLFLRLGFKRGDECCGIHEEGKDCFFVETNKLLDRTIYAVQTKKGNLKKTKEATKNVVEATTQLKTALATKIVILPSKEKVLPDYVILCASGEINKTAKDFICEQVSDQRIKFYDRDDLIPLIDQYYKELWLGIDADKMPYLRKFKEYLSQFNENSIVSDLIPTDSKLTVVTNERYVPLKVCFTQEFKRKYKGQIISEPKIHEIPAESLLKRNGAKFLILGEAGTGKSTILKRLSYVLCEQPIESGSSLIIPILLRTIDIIDNSQSLLDICYEAVQRISSLDKACFTSEDLAKGNVIILIDALDEEEKAEKIRQLIMKIEDFASSYPLCKIIITSRNYAYIKNLAELSLYEELRMSSFSLAQAKKIAERLIKGRSLPKEFTQEILRKLQDVHGLDLNPLLVTVFVATSEYSRKDIPANITELFKKFTEMMLGRWDSNKGINQQFHSNVKDFLLRKLAFQMHDKKEVSINEEDCINVFATELRKRGQKETDVDRLIHETLYRSGLFRCVEGRVEFRHLLIQEFFAGRGIPCSDIIPMKIKDPWWKRALVFYFGEHPSDNLALEKVIKESSFIDPFEQFQAAITVGLSLQACYLMETVDKKPLFEWVIVNLSSVNEDVICNDENLKKRFPLMLFIQYYLFGRDSVASDLIKEYISDISSNLLNNNILSNDRIKFWLIVGLIESGNLEEAEEYLKDFHPEDKRLLLALHLGCFLIDKLKIFSKEKQNIAGRICNKLADQIAPLRQQVIDEFRTELLEVRKDKLIALEHKAEKDIES